MREGGRRERLTHAPNAEHCPIFLAAQPSIPELTHTYTACARVTKHHHTIQEGSSSVERYENMDAVIEKPTSDQEEQPRVACV